MEASFAARALVLAVVLPVLSASAAVSPTGSAYIGAKPHIVRHHYRPGEILVKFKPGTKAATLDALSRQLGAVSSRELGKFPSKSSFAPNRWRHMVVARGTEVGEALRRFRADPNVEYAEPNYLISVAATPDDPEFSNQWGLHNTGQQSGVSGADIAAASAWDLQRGSPSVVVAVTDTGVDYAHPDVAANIWRNSGEIAGNGLDDDGNGYVDDVRGYDFFSNDADPQDAHGHGTHVAGILGAIGNNSTGIAGVAWSVKIMPLKIFGDDGAGDVISAIDGILYANQMGARIINASWGGYTYSQALRDAIEAIGSNGVLLVAGAGNDNNNNDVTPFYPASYDLPNVISVSATNRRDARADFSNYGRATVNLGAPGDNIISLKPGNRYAYMRGTSMAAPHVAGVAALLLSESPALSATGLKALLLDRSEQTPAMFGVTTSGGRLDAYSALTCDPSVMTLGVRAPAEDFVVLEGQPTVIRAQVTSCGRPVAGYEVTASFSNGDVTLTLLDDGQHGDGAAGDSLYGAYWLPQNIGDTSVSITATHASHPTLSRNLGGQIRQRVRYQHAAVPYAWIDATVGTGYPLGNDGSVTIPIGFNFDFYGIPRDAITINANGLLTFGSSLPAASNSRLPNPTLPNDLIAPFWDDLDFGPDGRVYTLLQGAEPNRRLTIAWASITRAGIAGNASFEATLYEGSHDIVFNYQDVDFGDSRYNNGASAVTGVEDPDGLDATVFSSRQRRIKNSTARRFYVVPAEPELSYRVTVNIDPSIRAGSGRLVMSVIDGDGTNNNFFNVLQFGTDGDVLQNPHLAGDASGSFIPGPAHIGDAGFVNEITQATIFGNRIRFLMKVSRSGVFHPYPDAYAFYLLDDSGRPYKTTDPFGTDSLFAIEIDRTQPVPQIFQSAYASVTVETVGAPIANAGGPYVGVRNMPVQFDGTASYDPEGQPINYNWEFGDGSTGTGVTPSHTYAAKGTYTATLVVDDVMLYSAPATAQVTIGASQGPVASAGPDQSVDQQTPVTLSGAGSYDPDGSIAGYAWRQIAGPAVALSGANTVTAEFTTPLVSAQTTLIFELTVRDNDGDTGRDTVNITVRKNNLPPVADAGPDRDVDEGVVVTLSMAGSSDPDGEITGAQWLQIAGPVAPLAPGASGGVSFTAPQVATDSVLAFQLTVTDEGGASDTDTVNVTVRNLDDPQANAGSDQAVNEGAVVMLDGTASSDPDGTITGYSWMQTSGILVDLGNPNAAVTSFTAPQVTENEQLQFHLTVTDNAGRSGTDTVNVLVRNVNVPPTANAGPDKSTNEGETLTLIGSGSDTDGSIVSYRWQQIAGPPVSLAGANTAATSFTAPPVTANTQLTFELTVTDNSGANATDSANVTVVNFNQLPHADAGPDQTVFEGATVRLNGSASSDADGTITRYRWTEGYADVDLSGADTATPSFVAPSVSEATQRLIQLEVTDDIGLTSTDSVMITIQDLEKDGDGDGLDDGWELQYFGSTAQGAGDDPDDDGLTNLQEYQSGSDPTVVDGVPAAPASVSARAGDTDAVITFGKSPAATRYDLYWSTSPSVSKTSGTRIADVTSPYIHSGRANGTTYYYVVVAGNLHGDSPDSTTTSARPGPRAWGNPVVAVEYAGYATTALGDGAGNAHVIYYRERVPNGPLDFYSVKYSATVGWSQPVLIASTPHWQNEYFTKLRAAMNRRGDTVISWTQDDGVRPNLWSSFQAAGSNTWEAPRLLENDPGWVQSNDISIGDDGLIAASWIQDEGGGGSAAYASLRRTTSSWSPRTRLDQAPGGSSAEVSVAADGNGGALFVWARALDGISTVQGARHSTGGWQAPVILFDNGSSSTLGSPEIGTDAEGNGIAVYSRADARGRYDVKASKFRVGSGWDATASTIDGATGEVLTVRLSVRPDGRAVAAWKQGTTLQANLMSADGTWSGIKSLSKTNAFPRGLVTDSLGRGLAIWSVTENGVSNTYSSIVTGAGWAPKLLVEDAATSTFVDGLVADDYGNATSLWREGGRIRANSFRVGNAGLGSGSGRGGGGGPKPK